MLREFSGSEENQCGVATAEDTKEKNSAAQTNTHWLTRPDRGCETYTVYEAPRNHPQSRAKFAKRLLSRYYRRNGLQKGVDHSKVVVVLEVEGSIPFTHPTLRAAFDFGRVSCTKLGRE